MSSFHCWDCLTGIHIQNFKETFFSCTVEFKRNGSTMALMFPIGILFSFLPFRNLIFQLELSKPIANYLYVSSGTSLQVCDYSAQETIRNTLEQY